MNNHAEKVEGSKARDRALGRRIGRLEDRVGALEDQHSLGERIDAIRELGERVTETGRDGLRAIEELEKGLGARVEALELRLDQLLRALEAADDLEAVRVPARQLLDEARDLESRGRRTRPGGQS